MAQCAQLGTKLDASALVRRRVLVTMFGQQRGLGEGARVPVARVPVG